MLSHVALCRVPVLPMQSHSVQAEHFGLASMFGPVDLKNQGIAAELPTIGGVLTGGSGNEVSKNTRKDVKQRNMQELN